ncbi:MAG: hypothetical protein R3A47_11070 [Polyangiales bacterium]
MKKFALVSVVFWAFVLVSGCSGSASVVRRDQIGGTLALRGNMDRAWDSAEAQMSAHCGGPYQIVSENRNVVGETSSASDGTYFNTNRYSSSANVQSYGSATTQELYEQQVTYRCGGGAQEPTARVEQSVPLIKVFNTCEAKLVNDSMRYTCDDANILVSNVGQSGAEIARPTIAKQFVDGMLKRGASVSGPTSNTSNSGVVFEEVKYTADDARFWVISAAVDTGYGTIHAACTTTQSNAARKHCRTLLESMVLELRNP